MNFLFGKKQTRSALAEVLADAEALANAEMSKPRYKDYAGPEVKIEVPVRVLTDDAPPFEARMKASVLKSFLLKPGVQVKVRYDPSKPALMELDDELPDILSRNPQLKR